MFNKVLKRTILAVSCILLFSLLIGRYLVPSYTTVKNSNLNFFLIGFAALLSAIELVNILYALVSNIKSIVIVFLTFPMKSADLQTIGVETPIDFAFAMCNILSYSPVPVLFGSGIFSRSPMASSPFLINRSMSLFEKRFGRLPLGYESKNWEYIMGLETSDMVGKSLESLQPHDTLDNVSLSVLHYFLIDRVIRDNDNNNNAA